jgi:hypothetical protein
MGKIIQRRERLECIRNSNWRITVVGFQKIAKKTAASLPKISLFSKIILRFDIMNVRVTMENL